MTPSAERPPSSAGDAARRALPAALVVALPAALVVVSTLLAASAAAQGRTGVPVKEQLPAGFVAARLQYGGGGDWYSNPSSLPNLLRALAARTTIPVETFEEQRVAVLDEELFSYPFVYMNGHGTVHFTADEADRLRTYLTSGGFLFADDNYGMDRSFRREMRKVFPDQNLVEIPYDHSIYHSFYDIDAGPPKVHEHDKRSAQGLGIFHEGRLVVFYTYESDVGDGIEDPDVHRDPPAVREAAMRMAINIVVYALTS